MKILILVLGSVLWSSQSWAHNLSETAAAYSPELVQKAEAGNAGAQYSLGVCYFKGKGVAQDEEVAVKWWTLAAKQGNAFAQFNLGECYDEGKGVAKDAKEAVRWISLAAKQGIPLAQKELERLQAK